MPTLPKLSAFFLFVSTIVFLLSSNTYGQDNNQMGNTGFIKFNFGAAAYKPGKYQKVSLFACNTIITDSVLTQLHDNGSPNQVVANIPIGWQTYKGPKKEKYYVSKYYIASPPIIKTLKAGDTIYDIGLVTPDEFELIGQKPVQLVYMDYNVLKPVYIEYLTIEFDSTFKNFPSFTVPFQVEAIDFPWLDSNGVHGAKGASGIGFLNNEKSPIKRIFLPYYYAADGFTKVYLNFKVTILNDILFHQKVFFNIDGVLHTSINLTDFKDGKRKIKFSRKHQAELPCGCKEPERARAEPKPKKKSPGNLSQSLEN